MSHIRIDRLEGVGTITIDRPARFNSLDVETARDLRKAGLQLARDESIRAVVVRGQPGIFCSGADLKYIRAGGSESELTYLKPLSPAGRGWREAPGEGIDGEPSPDPLRASPSPRGGEGKLGYGAIFKEILEYIHSTISEIKRAPKPFIAAVDGMAAAGGLGIAMACDLVIASDRATFEWAYSKTSLTGAESSTFFLPRLIGLRRSMELVLLNPRLDSRKAAEIGLITMAVSAAEFEDTVLGTARSLAAGPTGSYAIAKRLLNDAAGVDRLDYHLDRELENLAAIADTPAFAEGLAAFLEKRPPNFRGPAESPHA